MGRIIKGKDDIKVSIFSGDRSARVFIDSGYRDIAMVIADCDRMANGCYHIHHIEVVNIDRGWYGTYALYGRRMDQSDGEQQRRYIWIIL
jgi:hypothetical protein